MKAIEDQIKKTISESVSHKRVNSCNEVEKKEILNIDGNNFCADCNSPSEDDTLIMQLRLLVVTTFGQGGGHL